MDAAFDLRAWFQAGPGHVNQGGIFTAGDCRHTCRMCGCDNRDYRTIIFRTFVWNASGHLYHGNPGLCDADWKRYKVYVRRNGFPVATCLEDAFAQVKKWPRGRNLCWTTGSCELGICGQLLGYGNARGCGYFAVIPRDICGVVLGYLHGSAGKYCYIFSGDDVTHLCDFCLRIYAFGLHY